MSRPPKDTTPAIDECSNGPAMQKLSEMQQRFVMAMVEQGGLNYTNAAQAAGYSGDRKVLAVAGWKLAHDVRVQEAIREVGVRLLNSGTLVAVKTCLEIAGDPGAEKKDRLKASEMILNRVGMPATTEQKVTVTHVDKTDAEMVKRIEQLSKTLGIDSKKLLGNTVTDVEYSEVEENPLADLL